ncbi:hypothetical protein ACFE04_001743 [Oxalis oulophora]
MRSPRNGTGSHTPSPHHQQRFPTTTNHHSIGISEHNNNNNNNNKLRRFNSLIFVFRLAAFCFSLASSVFMITNSRGTDSPHWYDYYGYRYVFAANAIVAVYSLFEMSAAVWEITKGLTLLPEILQVWFDFSHDQVFAYLLLSANSAGTELATTLRSKETCADTNAFCVQSEISIALGFVGFMFLGFSSLLSGFRVACFIINGSRFYL